jgi:MFS family permease
MASVATHPARFLVLIVPFGINSGYVLVTLAWLLAHHGVSTADIGELVAVSYLPHSFKVLWAPVIDTTLSSRTWYWIANAVTGSLMIASGFVPMTTASLPLLEVVVFAFNVSATFVGMSVESLMAHATADDEKGRVGGWFQAGNLGGQGVGGGLGLWLAQYFDAPWIAGAALGAISLACVLALRWVNVAPQREQVRYGAAVAALARDIWSVLRSRAGVLALLLMFLPIGTGAASNLWAAVADDWHASVHTVELVTGVLSGLVSAAGCLVGGYICDRIDRRWSFALFGLLMAACALGMALAPRTEPMFVLFTMGYAFIVGLSYAGFTAVVLEAIGKGAAATKYNLFASLSNMPIAWMTYVEGITHSARGSGAMLMVDAVAALLALALFAAIAALTRRRGA